MQVDYDPERHAMIVPIGEGGIVFYGSTTVRAAHSDAYDLVTVELRLLRPRHPDSPMGRVSDNDLPPEDLP